MHAVVEKLLGSEEPSVRFKVLVNVLGRKLHSPEVVKLQDEIRNSERVKTLLSERGADGRIPLPPYSKWRGAHWVLATLAEIGYPPGDESLVPLREQTLQWLAGRKKVLVLDGRARWCASIEMNAVLAMLTLGLADERAGGIVERILDLEWPDGGWNCDKNPAAHVSSFHETLLPLRALALYAKLKKSREAKVAAERAAEVFLKRRLFRRLRDNEVMCPRFLDFHYPRYWHYDVLAGLVALAEGGFIADKRCAEALDLVESKQFPGGGWSADAKWYRVVKRESGRTSPREFGRTGKAGQSSLVDWGPIGKTRMNEFVTADALFVLNAAGRLRLS